MTMMTSKMQVFIKMKDEVKMHTTRHQTILARRAMTENFELCWTTFMKYFFIGCVSL